MLSFPSSLWVTDKNNIPNSKLYENLIENENIKIMFNTLLVILN